MVAFRACIFVLGSLASLGSLAACEHRGAAAREAAASNVAAVAAAAGAPDDDDAAPTPVLVELYTSQGCSSCPPADALLHELVRDHQGTTIVPLVFHVDYWNALGWPDPFSDPRWTARQRDRAHATGATSLYTPQLLFDGEDHRVGTQRARARAALRAESAAPPTVDLGLRVERERDSVRVHAQPRRRTATERSPLTIMAAVTDGGHRTEILAGENAGLTWEGDFVVRDLRRACTLGAEQDQAECSATLSLRAIDDPETMQIVAFAQDADWRIVGVATR